MSQAPALRDTSASHPLAAGVTLFELARIMGASVKMIERTYGHLVHDSLDNIRDRLGAYADVRAKSRPGQNQRVAD